MVDQKLTSIEKCCPILKCLQINVLTNVRQFGPILNWNIGNNQITQVKHDTRWNKEIAVIFVAILTVSMLGRDNWVRLNYSWSALFVVQGLFLSSLPTTFTKLKINVHSLNEYKRHEIINVAFADSQMSIVKAFQKLKRFSFVWSLRNLNTPPPQM